MLKKIKVLNAGYVEFKESMGTDATIVEAARMSTGRGFVSWEPYSRCKKCEEVWLRSDRAARTSGPLGCAHDWQQFERGDLGVRVRAAARRGAGGSTDGRGSRCLATCQWMGWREAQAAVAVLGSFAMGWATAKRGGEAKGEPR